MNPKNGIVAAFAIVILVAPACTGELEDGGSISSDPVFYSGESEIPVDSEADLALQPLDAGQADDEPVCSDAEAAEEPEHVARLEWVQTEETDALRLRVENTIEESLSMSVFVDYLGLITKQLTEDLGVYDLPPGGEILVEIPASEIPMQSTDHLCQAVAGAVATISPADEDSGQTGSVVAADVFYGHEDGYEDVTTYSVEEVEEIFDGVVVAVDPALVEAGAEAALDTALGRVDEGEGFVDFLVRDVAVTSEQDEETVVVIGQSFGGDPEDAENEASDPLD